MGGELLASLELGGGFVIVEVVGVGRLRGSHSAMVQARCKIILWAQKIMVNEAR